MRLVLPSSKRSNERGSALVSLIIAMTVIASLGATMLSSSSNAVFTQIGSIDSSKAYYLAEGGRLYAMNFIQDDLDNDTTSSVATLNNKTFTLGSGAGKFTTTLSANTSSNPHVFTLTVTGVPNSGTERTITYVISGS